MKRIVRLFFLTLVFAVFTGCNSKKFAYSSENEEYVSEISPSFIEYGSKISVSFTQDVKGNVNEALTFTPAQKGSWSLVDERTAVFNPDKAFKKNSSMLLKADLQSLFGENAISGVYTHPFYVGLPEYSVKMDKLELESDSKSYSLSGTLSCNSPVDNAKLNKVIKTKAFGVKPCIEWTKLIDKNAWQFNIKNISIKTRDYPLTVSWNGSFLGLSGKQDKTNSGKVVYTIPEQSKFCVVDVNKNTENTVYISFSKDLDPTQNINDFVKVQNFDGTYKKNTNSTIHNNIISIFDDENFENVKMITVASGVKSTNGSSLYSSKSVAMDVNWEIPSVKFLTQGNILPTSQGTVLPIETRNLSGIVVQAYAIYDHNMIQFLQRNEYNEFSEMYRVGEPVWTKAINFDWKDDMQNRYVPRGLDISELVRKYPKGMFEIRISFTKNQIKYICRSRHNDFSNLKMPDYLIEPEYTPNEKSNWDWFDGLSWQERDTFWTYRNDPCHPAFYMSRYNKNSLIKRNILVSDVGLMAKKTEANQLYVTASNLKTTRPMAGVPVTGYSYVGSIVEKSVTDTNGSARFNNADKIYFVTAENNGQCSYLKLGNGTNLSVSHFEVGGEKASNGVKGFIYGERGVWRPGDTMYLTFVLQDLNKTLPANIPVNFTLIDPLGRTVDSQVFTKSVNGFYPITTKSDEGGTTGLYNAIVKIGGKEWTKACRVETVVPNRMSVKLSPKNKVLKQGYNEFSLSGGWLHGAPTPNYKAEVSVSFSQANTSFDGYSDFTFTNPVTFADTSKDLLWKGTLGSNSIANFSENLSTNDDAPGKLKAKFTSKIFEPSGAFSTEVTSFDYSPYDRYVGLKLPKGDKARNMLLTDVEHTATVALLTEDGKKISSGTVNYEIYKIDWKWWWEKDAYTSATYVNYRSYDKIASGKVTITDGLGTFKFMVKYPSWGRYLIKVSDDRGGHSAGKIAYIDWPGWAGRSTEGSGGSSAMVMLAADKAKYTVGETASISFASSAGQRGLITIEKAGTIVNQAWIETTADTTVYKLPVTEMMAPNIYVHLTLLQPHMQTANSLPIRLYGVIPVMVDNPKTQLVPVITTASSYEPGKNISVSVSEKNGNPMTYTIAVVDEGLLGLTNFHAPILRNEFYKKEASMLKNWDLYSYVMNAYSGKLETLLAVGGGEDIIADANKDSNRFAPVVKFFGPYTIAAGEKKATTYMMPQYIGAVRTMVIAGYNGAYGTAEKTSTVKSDLMIQPALPRTLGAGEKISVPVTVFNGTDNTKEVLVSMRVRGVVSAQEKVTVDVAAGENKTVFFYVSPDKQGNANFNFTASSGEINTKSFVTVPVQSRGIPVTYRSDFTIKPGKTETVVVQSPGEVSSTKVKAELSTVPMINLSSRLEYLMKYPHGCIEQITSGAFPQLYLPDFVNLTAEQLERTKQNVISVFERYPNYQTQSGAMGYWQGEQKPSHWGSTYAAHFLTEAKKKGYAVPLEVYNPLINWLSETAADWNSDSYCSVEDQAYKLFVLALAGKADIGAMNRLMSSSLSTQSKLLLASGYALVGRKDYARNLVSQEKIAVSYYRLTGGNFGSSIREQAIALMAFNLCNDNANASRMAKNVATNLSADKWLSTQETAWSLFTLLPYYKADDSHVASYSISSNGEKIENHINGTVSIEELKSSSQDKQFAEITNTGSKQIFGTLYASGMSRPGTEKAQADGLSLTVSYMDSNGNTVTPKNLSQGDSFKITVRVYNTSGKDLENLALTIPVPTCWEMANDRIADDTEASHHNYRYMDIKDDAVYTYFDLKNKNSVVFDYEATVAYKGNYFVPAVHAEAMYDNDISAITPGTYVVQANR